MSIFSYFVNRLAVVMSGGTTISELGEEIERRNHQTRVLAREHRLRLGLVDFADEMKEETIYHAHVTWLQNGQRVDACNARVIIHRATCVVYPTPNSRDYITAQLGDLGFTINDK